MPEKTWSKSTISYAEILVDSVQSFGDHLPIWIINRGSVSLPVARISLYGSIRNFLSIDRLDSLNEWVEIASSNYGFWECTATQACYTELPPGYCTLLLLNKKAKHAPGYYRINWKNKKKSSPTFYWP